MTVETTTTIAGPYPTNGIATAFPFNFKSLSADEVEVVLVVSGAEAVVSPALYRVTLADQSGTVVFTSAPAAGANLYVRAKPDFTQSIAFSNQSAFLPNSHNEANDRSALRAQVLAEGLARTPSLPLEPAAVAGMFPKVRPDGTWGYDSAGPGATGPSNNTRRTLAELQAAAITDVSSIYDGSLWIWDPAAVANGKDRIASNNSMTGAWVQQSVTVDVSNAAFAGGARPSNTAAQNTAAFAAVGAFVSAIGGATIVIPRGTYLVGRQTFAGATGKGYAYRSEPILYINGCTRPVVIEGNGATLRFPDGMKMGSFDPVTGNAFTPTLPFTNRDYRADVGVMIQAYNNSSVTIRDLELDGNLQKHIMGGKWGDLDWQCYSTGIEGYGNLSTTIQNVNAHHCGLDGLMIGDPGLTVNQAARPVVISASTFLYNGRQGLSWIGGNSLTAIGCKFSYTGRAVNDSLGGPLFSAPGAGIDFEAEASVVRNGVFINCETLDNAGPGLLAEAGDVRDIRFTNCVTIGTTNWSTWFNKPGIIYEGGSIRGALVNQFASDYPSEATQFRGVLFSDESFAGLTPRVSGGISMFFTQLGQPVGYDACTFVATRGKIGRLDYAQVSNCRFDWRVPSSVVTDTDYAALFWSASLRNNAITGNNIVTGAGHYLGVNSATSFSDRNIITIVAGNLRWVTPTAGAGGYIGDFGQRPIGAIGSPVLQVFKQMAVTGRYGAVPIYANSAAPAAGSLPQGSVVINENAPAKGAPARWVQAGDGTVQPEGIIGAVQAAGLGSASTAADIVNALKAAGLAS